MKALQILPFLLLMFVSSISFSQGSSCANAEPFCTDNGATFPASTSTTAEVGPNYGCLGSQPNPAWYYLQISDAGNLDITLSNQDANGSAYDIDFIAWGPYASIGAMCYPTGSGIDCSFTTDPTEYLNITNAQVGEYYLVLITNFSGATTNISANQTGGGGATDCSIVDCNITSLDANISACNAGTFDITGQVEFGSSPTTGTLVVSTCSGDQQVFNPPFNSPINYSINGITADATPGCSVTATFTADPTCTLSTGTFTEPICTCAITYFETNIGACDPATNTFELNGSVEFTDQPTTGTLTVTNCSGDQQVFNAPFTSPTNYTISGIPADGTANCTVTAVFSADPSCTMTSNAFTEPSGCTCTALAGTFSGSVAGVSPNDYVLCFGDQVDLSSDLNYTPPGDESIGGITYDPGIAYLVYECPPTVFPTDPLWDATTGLPNDPCLLGVASYGDNFSDQNVLGGPSYAGNFTDNTIYYVPITTYSNVDGYYAISINGGPWCYDMGSTFAVQYLPEITDLSTEDCVTGSATFTITGGLPAVDGSNYTASNLLPATASFGNTTTPDGGTIVINGLQNGDNYSFDIIDANGCPQTFSGGPFQGGPVINSISPVDPQCNGGCDGSISINATDATLFSIDNGGNFQASNTFNNLCAGNYDIVVANAVGCQDLDVAVINDPAALTYSSALTDLLCFGQCTGEIDVTAGGGSGALQYSNDNGANFGLSNVFSNLCAGNYDIVVEDANGCQVTANEPIIEPAPLTLTLGITNPVCNSSCDGMINSIPAGGDGNYTYTWSSGQAVPLISNLCSGQYDLDIVDGNGCAIDTSVTLSGPAAAVINNVVEVDESCPGMCDGSLDIDATNVTQYSIDGVNFSANSLFTGLCAGNYTVYAQDINGCSATAPAVVASPTAVGANATSVSPICIDGSSLLSGSAAGGTAPYTYAWVDQTGASVFNTQNGNVSPVIDAVYTVTVTDANGCTAATNTLVQVNDSLTLTVFGDTPVCEGATSNLSALAGGGDGGPYTYTWDQGLGVGQNQTVNPSQTTVYTVTITDGCETPPISASVTIIVNTVPAISLTGDLLSGCAPVTTNFADNNVPAGSTCLWNFGDGGTSTQCGNPSYTFTEPGCWDVTLTITTAEGCTGSVTIPNYVCVFDYPTADFTFGPQPTTVMDPTISFVNLSFDADNYIWTFDVGGLEDQSIVEHPSYTFPSTNPGTYEVCLEAITDEGCADTTCQNVVIDEQFVVYVPNAFTPDGDLINNIFIPVVKGVDELKYSFMVFNRWGELIFEGTHPSQGWDGYHKGLLSQTDVYVWKLSCVDASSNKKHEFIGHVTLLK